MRPRDRLLALTLLAIAARLWACGDPVTLSEPDASIPPDVTPVDATVDSGAPADAVASDAAAPTDADASYDSPPTDARPFDVSALPGLCLWLEASRGVTRFDGGVVAAWGDLSGNGNNATQSITYNRPTYTEQAIHRLPGIRFDKDATWGQFLSIADAPSLRWGTGDFTLAVVARHDNDNGGGGSSNRFGVFYFKQSPTQGLVLQANSPGQTVAGGFAVEVSPDPVERLASTGGGYNDLRGHLFVARRVGALLELRHNGLADGARTAPVVDLSAVGSNVTVGATLERIDSTRLNGDIAEIVAVKGPLSDAALAELEAHLKAKYALP